MGHDGDLASRQASCDCEHYKLCVMCTVGNNKLINNVKSDSDMVIQYNTIFFITKEKQAQTRNTKRSALLAGGRMMVTI